MQIESPIQITFICSKKPNKTKKPNILTNYKLQTKIDNAELFYFDLIDGLLHIHSTKS